jgi:hypothetical protein
MRSKDRIEGTSNEKDSNNNTPHALVYGGLAYRLWHREST